MLSTFEILCYYVTSSKVTPIDEKVTSFSSLKYTKVEFAMELEVHVLVNKNSLSIIRKQDKIY